MDNKGVSLSFSFKGKKILITGGLGLTGSNLGRRLAEYGAEVSLFIRSLEDIKNVEDYKSKVEIITGDVRNYKDIEKAIKDKDYIFHLAGQSSVSVSMEDPFLDLDVNCRSTLNILESCRKHNKEANIVFSGTIRETGYIKDKFAREDQREDPTSIFDLHKLTSEKYLQIYHKVYGMNTTTLRFSNVFGDGQYKTDIHKSVINHIVKKSLIDKKLEIYGDGGPLRDYNYVQNVVDACLFAAQSKNTKGKHYILGSGEGRSFRQVLEALQRIMQEDYALAIEINKIPMPEMIGKTAQGDVIADYSQLTHDIGWQPKINFEDGLRKTIEFYRNN